MLKKTLDKPEVFECVFDTVKEEWLNEGYLFKFDIYNYLENALEAEIGIDGINTFNIYYSAILIGSSQAYALCI